MNPPPVDAATSSSAWLRLPEHWPAQGDLLQWCQNMGPGTAALLVLLGVVYLLFGWYLFKVLVLLNAAIVGAWIGAILGRSNGSEAACAFLGGFTAAALTWPLMKYAVAVMGGIFGGLLGASIWRTVGLEPQFAWAGALVGIIGFGMLSFILFRGSVMMYTSLQGSVMLVFGILGLIYKYQEVAPQVTNGLTLKPLLLPMIIFIPAILGLIYQQSMYPAPEEGKKPN